MEKISEVVLADGTKLTYVVVEKPPRGSMKYTYFTPDRSKVIQFYNNPQNASDENLQRRIRAILGRYNPTRPESGGGAQGNSETMAQYFSQCFCWPEQTVKKPEFGLVCPAYPAEFFFSGNVGISSRFSEFVSGRDKKSRWFISGKLRGYFKPAELGDFRTMLGAGIVLARAIRRMHQAGLAHSDLSCNNVLINPKTGHCVVIDIDSLVVPGIYPPEVLGTNGYMAPEIVETIQLPFGDPGRVLPSISTDLHSLAVLIYQFLFHRHPLEGPKVHDAQNAERDDALSQGSKALFIEHPEDHSNRPPDLHMSIHDMGAGLEALFLRAFVDGLHHPARRPAALEWEKALLAAYDLLCPCPNPKCNGKWFVLHNPHNPVCPFCGQHVRQDESVQLHMYTPWPGRYGQWRRQRDMNLYDGMELFRWHFLPNCFPDEKTEPSQWRRVAYIRRTDQTWTLYNEGVYGLSAQDGTPVAPGKKLILRDGEVFRAGGGQTSYLMEAAHGW